MEDFAGCECEVGSCVLRVKGGRLECGLGRGKKGGFFLVGEGGGLIA